MLKNRSSDERFLEGLKRLFFGPIRVSEEDKAQLLRLSKVRQEARELRVLVNESSVEVGKV